MDDQRIEDALRHGPPDEPSYASAIGALLAEADAPGSLADVAGSAAKSFDGVVGRPRVVSSNRVTGVGLAGTLAAAVVLVAVTLVLSHSSSSVPGSSPALDALGRLHAQDIVRIAVTNGSPQTTTAGDALIGFDVDVAKSLASSLGVRADIVGMAPSDILSGRGSWDLALPSSNSVAVAGVTNGPAYYAWPSWLIVRADSAARRQDDLAGARVCAVTGSAGIAWLHGDLPPGIAAANGPPRNIAIVEQSSDDECVAAIANGASDAAVSATLLDDEFAGRGMRPLTRDPVLVESRTVLVRGSGADVAALTTAIDRAVVNLHDSGTLAELSRAAFGGRDLTATVR
jgi:ABC-type amino acid transport substrate-binding protein